MRAKRLFIAIGFAGLLLTGGSLAAQEASETTFTVRIENISGGNTQIYSVIGVAGVPVGDTQRRAAMPGEAYEFVVRAAPGDRLSFATMYGQSNDSFYAPAEEGIALYDDMGSPVEGDVSDQVLLWDAGTEVNEPLGEGPNQGGRQPDPDAGEVENGTVQVIDMSDEFPVASESLRVTLTPEGENQIRVRIENQTGDAPVPTGISPVAYVVHRADQPGPFFTTGEADRGQGLERLAESGGAEALAAGVAGSAVMNVGASPGVFVIHSGDQLGPFFTAGEADRGQGLEAQAEDGSPVTLSESLAGAGYKQVGVFNTPVGANEPGPLGPGQAYEFTFTASPGDRLSFVQMFGQSNDLFFAPDENGIALFSPSGSPIGGTFTGAIQLWDAGTEVNQEPFVGPDQAPRQAGPNTGEDENGVVRPIYQVNDGFVYPGVISALRVTITNEMGMETNVMASADDMSMDDSGMGDEMDDDMDMESTPAS